MAYAATGLTPLFYGDLKGSGFFKYESDDSKATVDTAGYFNAAALELDVGHTIFCRLTANRSVQCWRKVTAVTKTAGSLAVTIAALDA